MARHILIVDDDDLSRDLMRAILALKGLSTSQAVSGEDAIAQLKSGTGRMPDMILMDIRMPGLDGCSVARMLKSDRKTRGLPIVAITALPPEFIPHSTQHFAHVFVKPVPFDDLMEWITGYFERVDQGVG